MSKQWPHKTIVGLTGNIATGKSAIMKMAAERGALTLDADKIVHEIMDNDPSMQAAIAVAFGPEVRKENGLIDRPALASIVFSDPDALRDLELMMHPAVRQAVRERIDESDADVVFVEAIKLLEGELVDLCDQVWVTRCPARVQIERLMVCRGLDDETAGVRVNAQGAQEAKVARADVVIDTDGTMAETRQQFELAWERLPAPGETPVEPEPEPEPEVETEPGAEAEPEPAPAGEGDADVDVTVTVRRARPSDIPAILLLMNRATDGAVKMKRSELLMSFSERSYLIGQVGTDINTVVGWNTDSTTAARIEKVYVHPLATAAVTVPHLLDEIEASATELICEVVFAFLPYDVPDEIRGVFTTAGYEVMEKAQMRRAWQEVVAEGQPDDTFIMAKVLRDIRVA